jgi:acylphosphatase
MEKARVQVIISGYVQGVFFRASTRDMAETLGLTGWVRNLANGSVEAVFEGDREELKKGVQWCYKGPPGARVTKVQEKWHDFAGEFKDFEIKYGS